MCKQVTFQWEKKLNLEEILEIAWIIRVMQFQLTISLTSLYLI